MARQQPNKCKLNSLMLTRLPAKDRPYLIWDTKAPGLAIQVQPSGHRAWKFIYSRHGRPRWYSIGRVEKIGLADARKIAGRLNVRVGDGDDPQADRKAERIEGTFDELAARYRDHAKTKNKSWEQADALVNKHLLPRWAKLKVTDIKRSDVKVMMARIKAPILANQVLAAASAIFTWGIREESIKAGFVHPVIGIARNATSERERILSDGELPKFWAAFDQAGLQGEALKMILLTGQRPGEVSHMRTEHIVDGWWEMPGKPVPALDWPGTKNGLTHRVWLPKAAQAIITEIGGDGLVFEGSRDTAITGLDKAMRGIWKQLEVERATPDDLRRTHGSAITGLGFGRDAMNRIQNHRDGGIAGVYDRHQYANENRKIMESVAAKFAMLIDGGAAANVVAFSRPF